MHNGRTVAIEGTLINNSNQSHTHILSDNTVIKNYFYQTGNRQRERFFLLPVVTLDKGTRENPRLGCTI